MTTPTNPPTNPTTPNSGTPPPGDGAGGATATAKPRKPRKTTGIELFSVSKDAKEIEKALKEGRKILVAVNKPEALRDPKKYVKPSTFKGAIKTVLGDQKLGPAVASEYSNKQIEVHSVHDSFKFTTKIEKIEHVNIQVNEG